MRIIPTRKGRVIESPWLREEDAAAYCAISRTEFHERAKDLPHAGKHRLRVYHQNVLDAWLNGELGIPFDVDEAPTPRRLQRPRRPAVDGITNPITGKFTPCPTD